MEILDEDEHGPATVAAADPDVMEPAAVSQGELAVGVDGVVSDAVVGIVERDPWRRCLGSGVVGLLGCAAGQRAVRAGGVVVVPESVKLALQSCQGPGAALAGEPA